MQQKANYLRCRFMKRIATLSLLCIYMVASLGVTVQSHYCMGRLISSSFQIQKSNAKCPKCGTTKHKKGCCEDKIQTFKIQNDQQTTATTFDFAAMSFDLIASDFLYFTPSFSYYTLSNVGLPLCNAPPNLRKVALYLFNCVLIR
jgi:hypothetical protein